MEEKMMKLMEAALEANRLEGFDVWVTLSGHVNNVEMRIEQNGKNIYRDSMWYEGELSKDTEEHLDIWITTLDNLGQGLTEDQITSQGFVFNQEFEHDQFLTKRYIQGIMIVEQTYEEGKVVSSHMLIKDITIYNLDLNKLKKAVALFKE